MSEDTAAEEEGVENEAGEASTRQRRLTDAEYAQIRELYELGVKGVMELSDEFKVSRQTLSRRFREDGVRRGSRAGELSSAVKAGATGAAAAAGAVATTRHIERFDDKREDWIEETRVQGYQALRQVDLLARKTISDTLKAGKSPAAADDDLKAIQRFGKILVDNLASRLELLNADEFIGEESLPSLMIEDLTEQDILNHHKMTGVMDDNATLEDLVGEVGGLDLEAGAE